MNPKELIRFAFGDQLQQTPAGPVLRSPPTSAPEWDTALARARHSADDTLRGRIDAFLRLPGPLATRGRLPRGRYCSDCRLTARYPDNRCPAHTAYLTGTDAERRAHDSDETLWLSTWRRWWEQVGAILGPAQSGTPCQDRDR
jgi:hypothetical protein